MKSKQKKIVVYQNRIYGFLLQSTHSYSYSPKTVCLRMNFFLPNLPSLGSPKSHHHDSKSTKIQNSKFKPTMFHDQSLS
jgi:hypothetical protein